MDRRMLILGTAAVMGTAATGGLLLAGAFAPLLVLAFVIGGMSNPLYSLIIAHTNDFLDHDDMAAAAGSMVFISGLGAVIGPLVTGWLMGVIGPRGFFVVMAVLSFAIVVYAAYRMTRRAAPLVTESYVAVAPSASPMAVEFAQDAVIDSAQETAIGGKAP